MKQLIVTSDDFGLSHGVNRGVVEAHREGIVTSASLLVHRPASEEAAALARACPGLSLGLHLELDTIPLGRVPQELERQLDRFKELVGAAPTHADSHHDVHRGPAVLPMALDWARRAGVPLRGSCGLRQITKFYGRWGNETHPEQIGEESLLALLDAETWDGVIELTCHPGYSEPDLASSYAAERELELRTLCEPRVRRAIVDRDIRLIGFRELRARP